MGKQVLRLKSAIEKTMAIKQDVPEYLAGLLGIFQAGRRVVKVPNRPGYVYVRVGGNMSEIIEAVNGAVPNDYDAKVLVTMDSYNPGTYVIVGRDLGQYPTYSDPGAFVPKHGLSHSFGDGSDPVFIYRRQMVQPLLPRPTNPRTMTVFIEPDFFYWNMQFQYWGGGNSPDLTSLKPLDGNSARYVTIFLEGDTNTIQVMTGTEFSIFPYAATGTFYFIPEIPTLAGLPLAAVLLVTGTSRIEWTDIKDLRMFLSAGDAVGGFITGSVLFANSDGSITEDNDGLHYDGSRLIAGYFKTLSANLTAKMQVNVVNDFAGMTVAGIYTGTVSPPFQTFGAFRGTPDSFMPLVSGSNLGRMNWTGSISGSVAPAPPIRIEAFANSDWNANATPAVLSIRVTPTGSLTSVEGLRVNWDSIDIVGKRFKLAGDMSVMPTGAVAGDLLKYDGTQWIPYTPVGATHSHFKHRLSVISGSQVFYLSGTATFVEFVSYNGFIADPDGYNLVSGSTYLAFINPLNTNGILTINFTM